MRTDALSSVVERRRVVFLGDCGRVCVLIVSIVVAVDMYRRIDSLLDIISFL